MLRTKIILKPFWSQLEISFRIHSEIICLYIYSFNQYKTYLNPLYKINIFIIKKPYIPQNSMRV